jgi:TatA/E family protein of Tat protein translocase
LLSPKSSARAHAPRNSFIEAQESRSRKVFPLFLEFLGTSELFVILVAALVLFGPRKLPELSRSLGKSLAEFKRASEDFKRTWEQEVSADDARREADVERAMLPEDNSIKGTGVERSAAVVLPSADNNNAAAPTIARTASTPFAPSNIDSYAPETLTEVATTPTAASALNDSTRNETPSSDQPSRKRDWL